MENKQGLEEAVKGRPFMMSFGGGTNSMAMLIGIKKKRLRKPDWILMADPGAEMPHTYRYIDIAQKWLKENKFPPITMVKYMNPDYSSLEDEITKKKTLPAKAFGFSTCSMKWKAQPQEKFIKAQPFMKEYMKRVGKIVTCLGIDFGEQRRIKNKNSDNDSFEYFYPLIEWKWDRVRCIKEIHSQGLALPGKSSCFFCPSMRLHEIQELQRNYPELFKRAIAIEREAQGTLIPDSEVSGLGRRRRWCDMVSADKKHLTLWEEDEKYNPCDSGYCMG